MQNTRTASNVWKTETSKSSSTCPRCTNKVTYEELREVFKDGSETLMKECLPYIKKHHEKYNNRIFIYLLSFQFL